MKRESCTLLIIGAGPGGYVCGIRAGQLGLDTIVVEREAPGGTCLNVGCIPSKALIHAAEEFARARAFAADNPLGITAAAPAIDMGQTQGWKDGIVGRLTSGVTGLLKKSGARYVKGRAQILDGKTVEVETDNGPLRISCKTLVIATGSEPVALPALPFGGPVISSTEALSLSEVPERLAVVGGGYIGLEIGTALAKLGAKVTVVEAAARILPQYDAALTKPVLTRLSELGVTAHISSRAEGLTAEGGALVAETPEGEIEIPASKVLVTVGRAPVLAGFGLRELGLTMDGPHIAIDTHCATSMRGVYAIGDITGEPMLAHRAMAQGMVVAEHVAGQPALWDKRAIPAVCFTDPEIVAVGALPGEVEGAKEALFPFASMALMCVVPRLFTGWPSSSDRCFSMASL